MIKPQVVNKLKSINELNLLLKLVNEPEGWIHYKESREWMANHLGIAEITLKKILRNLVQKTFINRISKGVYIINKEILQ